MTVLASLLLASLPDSAADAAAAAPPPGVPQAVAAWMTRWDGPQRLERQPDLPWRSTPATPADIVVEPGVTLQEIVGFGAALTDASAHLLRHGLDARRRSALLRELFSNDAGIGLSLLRLPIGASDFSLRHYSLDDVPAGTEDLALAHFSMEAGGEGVLSLARAARGVNPRLRFMASPWSAPAWMKTSGALIGGRLRADRYGVFAEYLSRFVQGSTAAGVPIYALTLQNEPHFEPPDYPGMRLDFAARSELIGRHVGPLFARRHPETRILEWDHNWDEPEEPLRVLADREARAFLAGVAWHCYRGDISAQSRVHAAYPEVLTFLTECSGGGWEPPGSDALTEMAARLLVGGTRHWASGVVLWNLVLDPRFGPHLGGCTDCRGVVTLDRRSGRLTRNPEYYALAHFSRFVRPGARRVQSTPGGNGLANVAFRNADDGSIVVVLVNTTRRLRRAAVHLHERTFDATLQPLSIVTYVVRGSQGER